MPSPNKDFAVLHLPHGFEFQHAQRLLIDELNNAIIAHQTLYGGNPGQWDVESAWGALQTISTELAMQFCRDLEPHRQGYAMPAPQRYAYDAARWFIRYCVEHPLVRSGATTNHDAAKFAKVLTSFLKFLVQGIVHPEPGKLYNEWKRLVSHV